MLIALGHKKNVGKNEVGYLLSDFLDLRTESFAAPLKRITEILYGWGGVLNAKYYEDDSLYHLKEKILPDLGKSPRQLYIEIGMAMRGIDPDVWVNCAEPNGIYTDLRFPNEFAWVKRNGGICIKIIRPGIPDTNDDADSALDGYAPWDHTIINNGTLIDLQVEVENICKLL